MVKWYDLKGVWITKQQQEFKNFFTDPFQTNLRGVETKKLWATNELANKVQEKHSRRLMTTWMSSTSCHLQRWDDEGHSTDAFYLSIKSLGKSFDVCQLLILLYLIQFLSANQSHCHRPNSFLGGLFSTNELSKLNNVSNVL